MDSIRDIRALENFYLTKVTSLEAEYGELAQCNKKMQSEFDACSARCEELQKRYTEVSLDNTDLKNLCSSTYGSTGKDIFRSVVCLYI